MKTFLIQIMLFCLTVSSLSYTNAQKKQVDPCVDKCKTLYDDNECHVRAWRFRKGCHRARECAGYYKCEPKVVFG